MQDAHGSHADRSSAIVATPAIPPLLPKPPPLPPPVVATLRRLLTATCPPRLPARQQVSHNVTHVIFDMDGLLLGEPQCPPSLSCRVFSTVPLTACLLPAKQACRRHSSTAPLPACIICPACLLPALPFADTEGFYTSVQQNLCRRFGKTFDWSLKAKVGRLDGGQKWQNAAGCWVLGAAIARHEGSRQPPDPPLACDGEGQHWKP